MRTCGVQSPIRTEVKHDRVSFLTKTMAIPLPVPPPMSNHGNYIVSLSNVVRWLGEQAEKAGVEIFPATAASEVLFNEDGSVAGIATGDMGLDKSGAAKVWPLPRDCLSAEEKGKKKGGLK